MKKSKMENRNDIGGPSSGSEDYAKLTEYSEIRRREFTEILSPVVETTDRYGVLICRVTNILGQSPSTSTQDLVIRDLMADVFDFLWEWRRPVFEGRIAVAYPLARRAYESISLLSICAQNPSFAERWERGKSISNSEVRTALASAPMPESEDGLKDLYKFFCKGTHPNRDLVPYRFLGDGNQFVLGSIGAPDLVFIFDHCIRLVEMWFWYVAAVGLFYETVIERFDKSFQEDYLTTAEEAKRTITWLVDNHNRLLRESKQNPD